MGVNEDGKIYIEINYRLLRMNRSKISNFGKGELRNVEC